MKSINDIYRDKIISKNKKNLLKYMLNSSCKEMDYILGIMLSDLYKVSFYTHSIDNNSTINFFKQNIGNIKSICKYSKELFDDSMDATAFFDDLDLINKIILFEELEESNNEEILFRINQFHFLDKVTYSFYYDLKLFKEIYLDSTIKSNDGNIASQYLFLKLDDLKTINYEKYKLFILEFVKAYYKYNFYFNNKNLYLDKITKYSYSDLYKLIEKDQVFIRHLLDSYLNFEILEEEQKKEINEYLKNNCDKKLQKKLKFNNKEKTS